MYINSVHPKAPIIRRKERKKEKMPQFGIHCSNPLQIRLAILRSGNTALVNKELEC